MLAMLKERTRPGEQLLTIAREAQWEEGTILLSQDFLG